MIDTRAVGQELQDLQHQIAGRIRKGRQTVAGTIRTWAQAAQTARPQIPALPRTALTDRLPSPEALAAGAYDLAEQLIAAQRRLAGQVTHAAMPLARQGAAMFGQSISQPGWSTARTSRKTASPTPAAKSSTAKNSTAKNSTAKNSTAENSTGARKPRSAKK